MGHSRVVCGEFHERHELLPIVAAVAGECAPRQDLGDAARRNGAVNALDLAGGVAMVPRAEKKPFREPKRSIIFASRKGVERRAQKEELAKFSGVAIGDERIVGRPASRNTALCSLGPSSWAFPGPLLLGGGGYPHCRAAAVSESTAAVFRVKV